MFKSKRLIYKTLNELCTVRMYSNQCSPPRNPFKLRRALIISKISKYEHEQERFSHLSKKQFEDLLVNRGTDLDSLTREYQTHKDFEKKIIKCFQDAGCEVKITNRSEFSASSIEELVRWADMIVPIGGDGTFIVAAGRLIPVFSQKEKQTPIVGFNSDPKKSEGRLMLPKHYTEHPEDAIAKIKSGDFRWLHRTRIRTTLLGNNGHLSDCVDLHTYNPKLTQVDSANVQKVSEEIGRKYKAKLMSIVPHLALNEVFIGETLSARVSLLKIILDGSDQENHTKCSGLCVSTGSGSTAWHTSINRLTKCEVRDMVNILVSKVDSKNINIEETVDEYNRNLIFPPDDPRMCYSVREQICGGVWPSPPEFMSRNFVENFFVQSKCVDASLVIDGSIAYPFNDGAKAILETKPEDALLTIALD